MSTIAERTAAEKNWSFHYRPLADWEISAALVAFTDQPSSWTRERRTALLTEAARRLNQPPRRNTNAKDTHPRSHDPRPVVVL